VTHFKFLDRKHVSENERLLQATVNHVYRKCGNVSEVMKMESLLIQITNWKAYPLAAATMTLSDLGHLLTAGFLSVIFRTGVQ